MDIKIGSDGLRGYEGDKCIFFVKNKFVTKSTLESFMGHMGVDISTIEDCLDSELGCFCPNKEVEMLNLRTSKIEHKKIYPNGEFNVKTKMYNGGRGTGVMIRHNGTVFVGVNVGEGEGRMTFDEANIILNEYRFNLVENKTGW